jgi:cobalt-zinc-cadmium efflux system outer membrane protein
LTLEAAISLLISNNLDLRAQFSEISQADSDILTASLRTNPILFADAQQIPYGSYKTAGTPIQYDVNMVHPLDISYKRRARTRSAIIGRQVEEAKYRDAVRLAISNLYKAYVDALVAQVNYDRATGKIDKHEDLLATVPVDEPVSALRDSQQRLAALLNIPPAEIVRRRLRGRLEFDRMSECPLPTFAELVRMALKSRPDLETLRVAVSLADSDIKAVMANRLEDVLLLYQPYTFHDGRPAELKNSLAWALGVTVPLPIYNRQQGNLMKARLIADQARIRLASRERAVASEVQGAMLEHEASHQAYTRTANDFTKFLQPGTGELVRMHDLNVDENLKTKIAAMEAQIKDMREDAKFDKLKKYYDALVRHRRSMLNLNTVTANCVMK